MSGYLQNLWRRGCSGWWIKAFILQRRLPGAGLPSKTSSCLLTRFTISTLDFFHGFLREYGIQLELLSPNVVLQLACFVVVYETFLGIEPNKDLFRWVFEVKTRKAYGSNGGVLAPVGGMNIQMCYDVSHSYLCLPLRSSNSRLAQELVLYS